MSSLTFIAELIKALAWPAVVLVGLVLLRRELRALVPLITKVKWKDFEMIFGREVAEARAEAARLTPPGGIAPPVAPTISETVAGLLQTSPRAAVVEAWRELELAARNAAIRRNVFHPQLGLTQPTRLISVLAANRVIEPEQVGLLHRLRSLRNEAAHAPDFALSEEAARNYAEAAAQLAEHLGSLGPLP